MIILSSGMASDSPFSHLERQSIVFNGSLTSIGFPADISQQMQPRRSIGDRARLYTEDDQTLLLIFTEPRFKKAIEIKLE